MPGLGELLSANPGLEQIFIYQLVGNLLSGAMGPFSKALSNEVNRLYQAYPLSPEELARLVIRGYISEDLAVAEAKESGLSPDDFKLLVKGTGNPLGPGELAEALRRGFIVEDDGSPDGTSFMSGIRQGDLQNKWGPIVKKLATQIPSASVIIGAIVEGQIGMEDGKAAFQKVGGDPEWFQLMYNAAGNSPTPVELGVAANRGIIPWDGEGPDSISFHQGFLEGPWRNKWESVFREVAKYHPPPRTVTTMVRDGSLTDEQALKLFQEAGLTPELAGSYLASAHHEKLAAHHELSLSIIEQLYVDKVLDAATAGKMIGDMGYNPEAVAYILSIQDLKRIQQSINRAITTVHGQYINRKIDRATASIDLDALAVAAQQRDELLGIWDTERAARNALLTPTQVRKAAGMVPPLITAEGALQRLITWGYSPEDAAIFMQL